VFVEPPLTLARKIPVMLGKLALLVLAVIVAMWGAGVDFTSAKDGLTGMSQGSAKTMTGRDDGGWG